MCSGFTPGRRNESLRGASGRARKSVKSNMWTHPLWKTPVNRGAAKSNFDDHNDLRLCMILINISARKESISGYHFIIYHFDWIYDSREHITVLMCVWIVIH